MRCATGKQARSDCVLRLRRVKRRAFAATHNMLVIQSHAAALACLNGHSMPQTSTAPVQAAGTAAGGHAAVPAAASAVRAPTPPLLPPAAPCLRRGVLSGRRLTCLRLAAGRVRVGRCAVAPAASASADARVAVFPAGKRQVRAAAPAPRALATV